MKKLISTILLITMLLPVSVSCAKADEGTNATSATTANNGEVTTDNTAEDAAFIDKADDGAGGGVGGVVAVVTHDKNMSGGDLDGEGHGKRHFPFAAVEIAVGGLIEYLRIFAVLVVDGYRLRHTVNIDPLTLGGDHALDDRLVELIVDITGLVENDDVALLWSVENIGNQKLFAVIKGLLHGFSAYGT